MRQATKANKRNNLLTFPDAKSRLFGKSRSNVVDVPLPLEAPPDNELRSYTLSDSSLEDLHLFQGDRLIVHTEYEEKEITENTVCVVQIGEQELLRRLTYGRGGRVTLRGGSDAYECKRNDFVITGVVYSAVRMLAEN